MEEIDALEIEKEKLLSDKEKEYKDRYWKEVGPYEPKIVSFSRSKAYTTLLVLTLLNGLGAILSTTFFLLEYFSYNSTPWLSIAAYLMYSFSFLLILTLAWFLIYRHKAIKDYERKKKEVDEAQEKILEERAMITKKIRKEVDEKYRLRLKELEDKIRSIK